MKHQYNSTIMPFLIRGGSYTVSELMKKQSVLKSNRKSVSKSVRKSVRKSNHKNRKSKKY